MRTPRLNKSRLTRSARRPAFSLVEILVVVVIMAALTCIALVSLGGSRRSTQSSACLSQLRQITMALRHYAADNKQFMPDPVVTGVSWAQSIQAYVGSPSVFACSADTEVYPLTGISYDWRDTGEPTTTMAGRKIDGATRTSAVLTFESLPGWHAPKEINAAWMDASVHTMSDIVCFKDLVTPIRALTATPP